MKTIIMPPKKIIITAIIIHLERASQASPPTIIAEKIKWIAKRNGL